MHDDEVGGLIEEVGVFGGGIGVEQHELVRAARLLVVVHARHHQISGGGGDDAGPARPAGQCPEDGAQLCVARDVVDVEWWQRYRWRVGVENDGRDDRAPLGRDGGGAVRV